MTGREEELEEELVEDLTTGVGPAGTMTVDSPREELVQALVRSRDLTLRQAQDILNLTEDSTPLSRVVGFVMGEFDVTGRSVEAALVNTDFDHLDIGQIEETKRSFLRSAGDIGGSARRGITDWFTRPLDWFAGAVHGVGGFNAPLDWDLDEAWYPTAHEGPIIRQDAWFRDTDEQAENKLDRARVRDATRTLIDLLNNEDYITNSQATKMKSVTNNYNEETYKDLHVELTAILEDYEYVRGTEAFIKRTMGSLERRAGSAMDPALSPQEQATRDSEQRAEDEATGAVVEAEEAVATQGWGEFDSFQALTNALGITSQQAGYDASRFETKKVSIGKLNIDVDGDGIVDFQTQGYDVIGPDAILDRATGTVMTNEMYNAIRQDSTLRRRYAELGKPVDAVQDLLDSNKFTNNGGFMPVEDLGIPSVTFGDRGGWVEGPDGEMVYQAGSEPWMAQPYNWAQGSGSAQWQSMSAYSRRAKVKYMLDSGMVTDKQASDFSNPFSLSGGAQWEQVLGVSREKQIAPYSAMNVIAAEVNRVRDIAGGGGGGGRAALRYSVPASLRTIPDYKALAEQTKSVFNTELGGRDMEDWELAALSDVLGDAYKTRNTQLIQADRAAWEDAVSGGTVDVSNFEVLNPQSTLAFDIGETYANELQRYEDVEDYGKSRSLLLDSIAVGQRMR